MKKVTHLSIFFIFIMFLFVFDSAVEADSSGAFPVCALLGNSTLMPGSSYVMLSLSAVPNGNFFAVVGRATFNSTNTPPGSLIVYSISGAASQNTNGWWLSLEGLGYDLAQTSYRGSIAIQLSSDLSNNTFTYSHEKLDGSSLLTTTGRATIWSAAECIIAE